MEAIASFSVDEKSPMLLTPRQIWNFKHPTGSV